MQWGYYKHMEKSPYKSAAEWRESSYINRCGYQATKAQGKLPWLYDLMGWKPPIRWTKERCIQEAKKYLTKIEWSKKSCSSYRTAWKNKWLPECTKHMVDGKKNKGYWTLEKCVQEAKKYKSISEWQKKKGGSYLVAYKNKWIPECTKHMIDSNKPNGYWTLDRCIEEAKKYNTRTKFRDGNQSAYVITIRNKWIDEIAKFCNFNK